MAASATSGHGPTAAPPRRLARDTDQEAAAPEPDSRVAKSSTAGKVLRLLEALVQEEGGVGVREIARESGIDKSAVSRLLDQFVELGLAEQDMVSGRFWAGSALFSMAATLHSRDTLWQAAEPILRDLVGRFNETCYLATRDSDGIVFREKVDCTHTVRYVIDPRERAPLHAGAGGRAVLVGIPEVEARELLKRTGLPAVTPRTITDVRELLRLVNQDRRRGYAISTGERVSGGCAIAAPYFDADGRCRGALVFTCPAERFDLRYAPEIAEAVVDASKRLSTRLGRRTPS